MTSDEPLETNQSEMYIIVTMLSVFSAVGSAGNALVLYVFSSTNDKLVSTLFIVVLAVVDLSTCLVIVPFTIVVELISYNVRFDLVCKLYQFLITSNIPFSALIMTAIAVDRYICICHPFAHLLTVARARVIVLVLAVVAAALGVCCSLTHSVYQRAAEDSSSSSENTTARVNLNWTQVSAWKNNDTAIYTGYCEPTDLILSNRFMQAFQKCYTGLFVVCLIVVVVLYTLIYLSVIRQRQKRLQMKAVSIRSCKPNTRDAKHTPRRAAVSNVSSSVRGEANAATTSAASPGIENRDFGCIDASQAEPTEMTVSPDGVKPVSENLVEETQMGDPVTEAARRNRIANIKTAAMLFVVTLVFSVSFFPALAMTVHLLPYNIVIFYMYFANNVANPIIYSFMNSNFQKQLARLFRKQ